MHRNANRTKIIHETVCKMRVALKSSKRSLDGSEFYLHRKQYGVD